LAGQGTKRRVLLIDNEPDTTTTLQVGLAEGCIDRHCDARA
jgi:hypothetical protein